MKKTHIAFAASAVITLGLSGCSSLASTPDNSSDGKLQVSASFYPIAWLTEQIGGDAVDVTLITPGNVEPHDFELSPKDIAKLEDADTIIYVPDFQPSLDDAVALISGPTILDLTSTVDLVPLSEDTDGNHSVASEEESADGHSTTDPHFWLDPHRMEAAAGAIEKQLATSDPENADLFAANLSTVQTSLSDLDDSLTAGLQTCERRTIVASHSAFGYFADRYDLEQVSISGIDPESEPSPANLAAMKKVIESTGSTTVFTEELVSSKTADALATETGATTKVLNTLEAQPEDGDYVSAMTDNLSALRTALDCQ